MAHTYASVAEADDYMLSNGASVLSTQPAATVARKLAALESISRLIDEKMERSEFGSGFGPRIGTNRYDGQGGSVLRLRDDLLSVTSITIRESTAAVATKTPVADTDYYLIDEDGGYSQAPYRKILLHGQGAITAYGTGYRVTDVAGTWGNSNQTRTLVPTVTEALDLTETGIDVSATTDLSPGLTLLLDSEHVYVRSIASLTLTVDRAANGSTAATHLTGIAIARYLYPAAVTDLALRLYLRRWKSRDAGADGSDGGGDMPLVTPREGEDTIIRRTLYGMRLKEMV